MPMSSKRLGAAFLRALETLANASAVAREKARLAQVRAALNDSAQEEAQQQQQPQQQLQAPRAPPRAVLVDGDAKQHAAQPPSQAALSVVETAAGDVGKAYERGGAQGGEQAAGGARVDRSIARLQKQVARMLDLLEVDIEAADAKIGDKLHMLDRDCDGFASAQELAFVIQHMLTHRVSNDEAAALVAELDPDRDGRISVRDLPEPREISAAVRADSDKQDADGRIEAHSLLLYTIQITGISSALLVHFMRVGSVLYPGQDLIHVLNTVYWSFTFLTEAELRDMTAEILRAVTAPYH
ncbi:hypothetical protein JKP88DRAFT_304403 [Tribonema minus]|uniref:EF-hand domain-containing protein n=1 Tax=Tribonema minus TaxID=303371 RepID=A0A835ZDU6_9STRA|nr:hypothetical protein JKP88DRAFT_304403 [Tribonema minus]